MQEDTLAEASGSGRWLAWQWELLPPVPEEPHVQMALDEVLLSSVVEGRRPPTLRFWDWAAPALVLGSHQSVRNEVDAREAAKRGFTITRRMSGGGTMLVEPSRTITYSLYAPAGLVANLSFVESFAFLDAWVVAALREMGVDAGHRPINDIVSPEGKIGGAAQARRRGHVLHHTTLAFSMDMQSLPRLIRIGRRRRSRLGIRSAEKHVSPLDRFLDRSRDAVVEALMAWFAARRRARYGEVTAAEHERALQLVDSKYGRQEWIRRLP